MFTETIFSMLHNDKIYVKHKLFYQLRNLKMSQWKMIRLYLAKMNELINGNTVYFI